MATDGAIQGTLRRKGAHKQEEALAALLVNPTRKAAAEACGIGLRTIMRYLAEPEFAERYAQAKSELVSGMTNKLRTNGLEAVEMLLEVATDKEAPSAARVTAARSIIEFVLRAHENEDFDARLKRLESERGDGDGE